MSIKIDHKICPTNFPTLDFNMALEMCERMKVVLDVFMIACEHIPQPKDTKCWFWKFYIKEKIFVGIKGLNFR